MTEKRFKLKYINEQHISANLYDNETFIGSIGIGGELIVELLNDLSEENEQLKQREKTLEGMIRTFDEGCKEIYDDKCRLEEENEQLKQEVENIKDVNVRCCNDYSHYRRENEQLKSILKIYHKVANCRNCHYHDYDTLFGGYDDYEICNKGNDVSDGICSEWREH